MFAAIGANGLCILFSNVHCSRKKYLRIMCVHEQETQKVIIRCI